MTRCVSDDGPASGQRRTVGAIRMEQGIGMQELVERTGISERVLRLIERKHYRASPQQTQVLCDALGVSPDDLDIGLPETKPGTWGTGGTYS